VGSRLGLVPVDVGVAKLKAELPVEPVGRDPGGPGGQVEQGGGLVAGDPGQALGVEWCCGLGELGQETSGSFDESVGDLVDRLDLHAHTQTVPDRVVSSAPRA
jgi:hypothetical protein